MTETNIPRRSLEENPFYRLGVALQALRIIAAGSIVDPKLVAADALAMVGNPADKPTYDRRMINGERIDPAILAAACPFCGNGPATSDGSPCPLCDS
jgi:hypothetical protein